LIIAAADTVMNRPSAALFGEVFPGVPFTRDIGEFETLLDIDRAREVIGYEPASLLARSHSGVLTYPEFESSSH
jgi:hypothetical protein